MLESNPTPSPNQQSLADNEPRNSCPVESFRIMCSASIGPAVENDPVILDIVDASQGHNHCTNMKPSGPAWMENPNQTEPCGRSFFEKQRDPVPNSQEFTGPQGSSHCPTPDGVVGAEKAEGSLTRPL